MQRATAAGVAGGSKRTEVSADRALLEFARIGFSDLRDAFTEDGKLLPPHKWPNDLAPAIASVKVSTKEGEGGEVIALHEIKLWDKGKALEQLSKHLGLYRERPQDRPREPLLPQMTDEEVIDRLLDHRARRTQLRDAKSEDERKTH